MARSTANRSIV